ncbi:MAG TPA: GNAT family N-acetyltransferase [Candidatus Limnocylindrales bacterium]|nr:GNAT family N-acetyltransferase [Candidatus Limnocylindrales bacterium]
MPESLRDPALGERLLLHEARAQQSPGRELRDLGDGWLFYDPADPEPFWNRLIGPRWPSEPARFARRLDEVVTLFATLDRIAHVRPLPAGNEPADIEARLLASGFDRIGSDRRMVLVDPGPARRLVAAWAPRLTGPLTVDRQPGRPLAIREGWAEDAALVVGEAFGVDPFRRVALETDMLACAARPGCSVVLLRHDGQPVAVARRATVAGGSYLSSIGTRPAWRGRGYGSLVTALAVVEALDAGGELVHLAVDVLNAHGQGFYEALGFAVLGDPVADLVLR